jgi:hypothetical protein
LSLTDKEEVEKHNMSEYDEELPDILLGVLQFESNVHTIAAIGAQAAVMHELGVTRRGGGDYSVRSMDPVANRLQVLWSAHPSIFKGQTGFFASEFEAACRQVAPVFYRNARSTELPRVKDGRPLTLDPRERVLSFVLKVKHNSGVRDESSSWNWSRSSLC